jgi:endonuclease-3
MTALANRAEKFNKLYKVVKKYYQPVLSPANRTVLEHLVYACCLEDSTHEAADEVLAKLQVDYFDWNEIRVTTSLELAELMKGLHDPLAAAGRLRKVLHGLFESKYSFDAEFLKKENLGKAIEQLEKYKGISPFVVATVAQLALGGHSIPVDQALLSLMYTIGAISEEEQKQGKIPGLERTIPKNKGPEFASLVHQLAVAFHANPQDKNVRDIILQIDSEAAERFPKRSRGRKKPDEPVATPAAVKPTLGKPTLGKPTLGKPTLGKPTLGKPTLGKPTLGKAEAQPTAAGKAKKSLDKPAAEKVAAKPVAEKSDAKAAAKKPAKPAAKPESKPVAAKPPVPKKTLPKPVVKKAAVKPQAKVIAKKKPR